MAPGPILPAPEVQAQLTARITYSAILRNMKEGDAIRILARNTLVAPNIIREWIRQWKAEVQAVVRDSGDPRWIQQEVAELYQDCKMRVVHYNMLTQTTQEPEKALGEARKEAELMLKLQDRLLAVSKMTLDNANALEVEEREKTALELLAETKLALSAGKQQAEEEDEGESAES